jgi:hypothetical protein
MKVEGQCHCGQIRYEAEVDPDRVSICHCSDCQVLTGTAFRVSVPTESGTLRFLSGTPRVYVKTTADSGNKRRHAFCANCGSPISASADTDSPSTYTLRVGGLAQKARLPPKRRIWCKSALDWSLDISSVPGIPGQ